MHPILFSIFGFKIHSYGFMLALSFLLGIWLATYRAKKRGLDPNVITDVGFYLILSAIVGARLYYVFLKWHLFKNDLLSIFNPFQNGQVGIGGLVMYGGFIGALVAGILYFRIKKHPFLPYADTIAPALGVGIALTRIGCFLNGCCYGGHALHGGGVHFIDNGSPAWYYQLHLARELAIQQGIKVADLVQSISLYPSQIYLSLGGLALAIIVILAGRKKLFDGFEFYLMGLLYAILRFSVDFTRFYDVDERLGPLSHNQIVCIALFIVFGGLLLTPLIVRSDSGNDSTPTT